MSVCKWFFVGQSFNRGSKDHEFYMCSVFGAKEVTTNGHKPKNHKCGKVRHKNEQ